MYESMWVSECMSAWFFMSTRKPKIYFVSQLWMFSLFFEYELRTHLFSARNDLYLEREENPPLPLPSLSFSFIWITVDFPSLTMTITIFFVNFFAFPWEFCRNEFKFNWFVFAPSLLTMNLDSYTVCVPLWRTELYSFTVRKIKRKEKMVAKW